MDSSALLTMLKVDLGISTTTSYDERLTQYLATAQAEIAREGGFLEPSSADDMALVVMYAAWLWRKRDNMEGMPRMLRYALNNRIFQEKMA